jgi:hypothetical protein
VHLEGEDYQGKTSAPRQNLAEHQRPGDGLQRPLVPRSRFQTRLMPGVRGAANKAAHLGGCKSLYRQLPDADGEHIHCSGR